jgi:pyruvate/2-oxoglutarate dehydrogenase complex dihydrolipoamide acyltransferase (E2) component
MFVAHVLVAVQVTIDVRAPTRGILRALTVKEEDTVTVGAVVAVLDEQEGTSPAVAAPPPAENVPQKKTVDLEELTAAASEISDSSLRGHKARISFPPRRTPDGFVISAMPAVDQQKYISRSASAAPLVAAGLGATAAASVLQASSAASAYIARRTLSEKEMEYIMLGGAEP